MEAIKTIYALLQIFWKPLLVFVLFFGVAVALDQGKGPITCIPTGPDTEECFRR